MHFRLCMVPVKRVIGGIWHVMEHHMLHRLPICFLGNFAMLPEHCDTSRLTLTCVVFAPSHLRLQCVQHALHSLEPVELGFFSQRPEQEAASEQLGFKVRCLGLHLAAISGPKQLR